MHIDNTIQGKRVGLYVKFRTYIFMLKGFRNKHCLSRDGGRLNKKDGLTRYGNSHVKDKTS